MPSSASREAGGWNDAPRKVLPWEAQLCTQAPAAIATAVATAAQPRRTRAGKTSLSLAHSLTAPGAETSCYTSGSKLQHPS